MLRLDLDRLVGRADRVVVGKVSAVRYLRGAGGRIFTEATVQVERTVVGAPGKTVTLRALGGVLDGIGMRVAGAPEFRVGQRVLAFTELRQKHRYVIGMRQGLFQLTRNAQGQSVLRRSLAGLTFARRDAAGKVQLGAEPTLLDEPQRLEVFIARIQATAKRCAARADRCLAERRLAAPSLPTHQR